MVSAMPTLHTFVFTLFCLVPHTSLESPTLCSSWTTLN